jgi:SAM-dependent methyltransferase
MKRPYDEIAHLYDSEFFPGRCLFLLKLLAPSSLLSFLEIGCGTGRAAIPLAQKGYKTANARKKTPSGWFLDRRDVW